MRALRLGRAASQALLARAHAPLPTPAIFSKARGFSVTRGDAVIELHGVTSKLPDGRTLFENVSLSLLSKTFVGIVGPNGAGKSTFLKILAGVPGTFGDGKVSIRAGTRVTYLSQEPDLDDTRTVRQNVAEGAGPAAGLLTRFEAVNLALEDPKVVDNEALLAEQSELLTALDACGAWDLQSRVDRAMAELSLPPPDAVVGTLSGGEKRRVALCRALMEAPDVLLLDEPTNHLDAHSVAWLEGFLREFQGSVVAVTHDRALLEALAQWVVDVEHGGLRIYEGNYSTYLAKKGESLETGKAKQVALSKQVARELDFIRSNKNGSKSGARLARFEELNAAAADGSAREAEMVAGAIVLPPPRRKLGANVIEAEGLGASLPSGRVLFKGLSFSLPPGGIVGVVGRNGCGKTSLFNLIARGAGEEHLVADPRSGRGAAAAGSEAGSGAVPAALAGPIEVGTVKVGESVSLGLVSQSRGGLDGNQTVLEAIAEGEDTLVFGDRRVPVRSYIASFGLKGPSQGKRVGVLSGGERNRVHLARVLKQGHNVLLLDEPTNDLDVHTLRALEEALMNFPGCAVVISHDRWFLDRICTHTLSFEEPDDGSNREAKGAGASGALVEFYPGSYSEYREHKARNARRGKTGPAGPGLNGHAVSAAVQAALAGGSGGERPAAAPSNKKDNKKDKKKK